MAEVFLAESGGKAGFQKKLVIKRVLAHLRGIALRPAFVLVSGDLTHDGTAAKTLDAAHVYEGAPPS